MIGAHEPTAGFHDFEHRVGPLLKLRANYSALTPDSTMEIAGRGTARFCQIPDGDAADHVRRASSERLRPGVPIATARVRPS